MCTQPGSLHSFSCVCVTLGVIGILFGFDVAFSYAFAFDFLVQGGNEHFGRHCPTKTLPLCCDIPEGRLGNVPAIFHFEWREAKPRTSLNLAFLHVRRHLVVRSIDAFLLELLAT